MVDLLLELPCRLVGVVGILMPGLCILQGLLLGEQVALPRGRAEYQFAVADITAEHGVVAGGETVRRDAAPGQAQGIGIRHPHHAAVGGPEVVFGDAVGKTQHMENGVFRQRLALGVPACLFALDHPGAIAARARPAQDTNGLGLELRLHQDAETGAAQIALDGHLPVRIGDLHMVAKHPRVGLGALLADRRQRLVHVPGVADPVRLQGLDLLLDTLLFLLDAAQLPFAVGDQPVQALGQRVCFPLPLGFADGVQDIRQCIVQGLFLAAQVQSGLQRAQVDPVTRQQLVEVGQRPVGAGQQLFRRVAPTASGQFGQQQLQTVAA